jgi:hypothetical protein
VWTGHPHRATRDLDLLGFGDAMEERLRTVFTEVARVTVPDDGVSFDAERIETSSIREGQEYGGVRVHLSARIATAVIRLQVDVGFGDAITPAAVEVEFPPLLDFPAPRLRAYPRETVVAEKLQAMVSLGLANSRMKDFHDLVELSRIFSFDGDPLVQAIRATFERGGTAIPEDVPVAFTSAFSHDKQKLEQWRVFVRKADVKAPPDLETTIALVARFASEPLAAARDTASWSARWPPGGPWAASETVAGTGHSRIANDARTGSGGRPLDRQGSGVEPVDEPRRGRGEAGRGSVQPDGDALATGGCARAAGRGRSSRERAYALGRGDEVGHRAEHLPA